MPDEPPLTAPEPEVPDPELAPLPPGTGTTGLAPNIAATIACALPLVGGIVFLLLEKRDAFVRFYAMQSIIFVGASLLVSLSLQIIGFVFHTVPLLGALIGLLLWVATLAFGVFWTVIYVVQIVKAFAGVEWEIPYLGPIARKQLAHSAL